MSNVKLINNLKMRCDISRLPVNPASQMDDQGMYNPDFSPIATNVKCYLQYFRLAGGKLLVSEAGQEPKNEIICFLQKGTDVKIGDRIDCSSFYPYTFYVDSVNPIINGRTGALSHFECIMGIERKN